MGKVLESFLRRLIDMQGLGVRLLRIAIAIVLIWIGGLKFFDYEAEGIVPFVANSPFMSFFYSHPDDYNGQILKEGAVDAANHQWHTSNNTYIFSYGLGVVLIMIGSTLLLNKFSPVMGIIGAMSVLIMSIVTLSFLITTPETWVPSLGGPDHGFPFLSGRGRLVVKDVIMMAGAFIALIDSAKTFLEQNNTKSATMEFRKNPTSPRRA